MLAAKPRTDTQPVLQARSRDEKPIDWQTLYKRTVEKFPKTLKRLGE